MKGFLFDCTECLGNLHRKTYRIAVFAPKINTETAKFLLFPVQYYRRFLYSKIPSKNRWFVPNCCTNQKPHKHWLFEVKIKWNLSKSGLYQNVIKTSFDGWGLYLKCMQNLFHEFQNLRCYRQRKSEKIIAFSFWLDRTFVRCYNKYAQYEHDDYCSIVK